MRNKTLNILGSKWKLKYKKKVIDPETGGELSGLADYATKEIHVSTYYNERCSKKRTQLEMKRTLIHEMSHAGLFEMGIHNQVGWSLDFEHIFTAVNEMLFTSNKID